MVFLPMRDAYLGRLGAEKGFPEWQVDQWDELCIGILRCTSAQRLAGIPGQCVGLSILRAAVCSCLGPPPVARPVLCFLLSQGQGCISRLSYDLLLELRAGRERGGLFAFLAIATRAFF